MERRASAVSSAAKKAGPAVEWDEPSLLRGGAPGVVRLPG